MASFVSGLIQLALAPFADVIASKIPRVALLSGLSGLGIVYLSLRFCSEVRWACLRAFALQHRAPTARWLTPECAVVDPCGSENRLGPPLAPSLQVFKEPVYGIIPLVIMLLSFVSRYVGWAGAVSRAGWENSPVVPVHDAHPSVWGSPHYRGVETHPSHPLGSPPRLWPLP
jgi:hypothetical protein